jgi:hypothetical protein
MQYIARNCRSLCPLDLWAERHISIMLWQADSTHSIAFGMSIVRLSMVSQQLRCVDIARLVGTKAVIALSEAMADPMDQTQGRDWGMVVGYMGRFGEEFGSIVAKRHAETVHVFGPYWSLVSSKTSCPH